MNQYLKIIIAFLIGCVVFAVPLTTTLITERRNVGLCSPCSTTSTTKVIYNIQDLKVGQKVMINNVEYVLTGYEDDPFYNRIQFTFKTKDK
jgi:hypothetical protein